MTKESGHASHGFPIVLSVVILTLVCAFVAAVFGCKPAPRAYLTQEELDDARLRREDDKVCIE